MYETLIKFYESHKNNIRFFEDSEEVKEIRKLTSFLDNSGLFKKISYKQRMWHIINKEFSLKKCVVCGHSIKWNESNKCYPATCSKECYKKYSISQEIREKISRSIKERYDRPNKKSTSIKCPLAVSIDKSLFKS